MHPWVWLNEPQHSSAVQAVTAIVFGIASVVVAIYSFRYLVRAALAADAQVKAANEQIEVARTVLREQVRPHLKLIRVNESLAYNDLNQRLLVRNVGPGAAYNIVLGFFRDTGGRQSLGSYSMELAAIAPESDLAFPATPGQFQSMKIWYRDALGKRFLGDAVLFDDFVSVMNFDYEGLPQPDTRVFDYLSPCTAEEFLRKNTNAEQRT